MTSRSRMVMVSLVARPREFDETEALDRAMLVFWQRGYAGTSVADLVEATGLQRQSLYNTFGDKQALFARALRRYAEKMHDFYAPLRAPEAGLAELRMMMLAGVAYQQRNECGTCMAVKTAFDHQVNEPQMREAVRRGALESRRLIAGVLRQAQQAGEVPEGADVEALAVYLFGVQNGLSALAQTGSSQKDIEASLDLALSTVTGKPPARPTKSSESESSRPRRTSPRLQRTKVAS